MQNGEREILQHVCKNLSIFLRALLDNSYGDLRAAVRRPVGIKKKVKLGPGLASLIFNAVTGSGLC